MSDRTNAALLPRQPARPQILTSVAMAVGGLLFGSTATHANADDPISHSAESIHQEVIFKATRKRVYDALTDAKQFEQVVRLSDAMKMRMSVGAPPTQISTEPGGAFSTLGGLIIGRQIELVPTNESSRPGVPPTGIPASTRSYGLNSRKVARAPNSPSTTKVSRTATP
jgi:hypothetical protein